MQPETSTCANCGRPVYLAEPTAFSGSRWWHTIGDPGPSGAWAGIAECDNSNPDTTYAAPSPA